MVATVAGIVVAFEGGNAVDVETVHQEATEEGLMAVADEAVSQDLWFLTNTNSTMFTNYH